LGGRLSVCSIISTTTQSNGYIRLSNDDISDTRVSGLDPTVGGLGVGSLGTDRLVQRLLEVMNCSSDCTTHIAQLARPEQNQDEH
jgi:hypothetical protein